jgi:hypothetical protein
MSGLNADQPGNALPDDRMIVDAKNTDAIGIGSHHLSISGNLSDVIRMGRTRLLLYRGCALDIETQSVPRYRPLSHVDAVGEIDIERLRGATIDFATVADFYHFNGASCVVNRVDDAELTFTNAMAFFSSSKFFTASGPRFGSEPCDSVNDALTILLLAVRFDLVSGRGLDKQPISGHVTLGHGQRIRRKRFAHAYARRRRQDPGLRSGVFVVTITYARDLRSGQAGEDACRTRLGFRGRSNSF